MKDIKHAMAFKMEQIECAEGGTVKVSGLNTPFCISLWLGLDLSVLSLHVLLMSVQSFTG